MRILLMAQILLIPVILVILLLKTLAPKSDKISIGSDSDTKPDKTPVKFI
jgi:hypothetical protein